MIIDYKALRYRDKVIFEKMTMRHFKRFLKPFNGNEACFMYLLEGSFQLRTPERVLQFNSGEGLLAKCSEYFFEQSKKHHEVSVQTTGIGIYLYPSIIKELFEFDFSISDFETDYDATKVDIAKIKPETSFIDDLNLDSLDIVELMMKMEDEFGVEIPEEDAEGLRNVSDVVSYITKKQ